MKFILIVDEQKLLQKTICHCNQNGKSIFTLLRNYTNISFRGETICKWCGLNLGHEKQLNLHIQKHHGRELLIANLTFFKVFTKYYHGNEIEGEGLYTLIVQLLQQSSCTDSSVGEMIYDIKSTKRSYFDKYEDRGLFEYTDGSTGNNILTLLATKGLDGPIRKLLSNYFTKYHVTHDSLQHRNYSGQTLVSIMEVNRSVLQLTFWKRF